MPRRKKCVCLYSLSLKETAKQLLKGCQFIDSKTEPFSQYNKLRDSPLKISPSREVEDLDLNAEQRVLKVWVGNLPDTVVQDVFRLAMLQLESQLMIDKDKKLILTLINIESIKMSDFLFGVHSLLKILRGFSITDLNISKRLWLILWEYEEILHQGLLKEAISEALPHFASISSLSLPYLADDRIMNVIRKYLPCLTNLDVSHSCITDKGLRHLMSPLCVLHRPDQPNPNIIRNLTSFLDSPERVYSSNFRLSLEPRSDKCLAKQLETLKLESCDSVTDSGVRFILEHFSNLKVLIYHQRRSVLEILLKWLTEHNDSEKTPELRLEHLEHAFPYSIAPFSEQLTTLRIICPKVTTINIVTEDFVLPHLVGFCNLTTLTVELEDCIGEGFISFLKQKGSELSELYVSCSTDPESTLSTVEGGHQGQLFNIVTVAAGMYCTKEANDDMQLTFRLNSTSWIKNNAQSWFRQLTHLMLMSYEDTMPSMTIHSVLLQHVLRNLPLLQVLNMEGNFGTFITDDYMRSILRENTFPCLRILDISVNDHGGVQGRVPLSLVTVQAFIDKCSSLAEFRMSDWNISGEEFNNLVKFMLALKQCLRFGLTHRNHVTAFRQVHIDIWQHTPQEASPTNPTVLLFGYAGSPKSHLVKFEQLYSELGYQVMEKVDEAAVQNVVVHSFSNNGIIMYEHLYYKLQQENRFNMFKGLILDSGPGPMGCRDNFYKKNYTDKQSSIFLPIALFSVNAANRVPLAQNIRQVTETIRVLPGNYNKNKHIPWTGAFLTHHEKGTWPLMLLYSKEDDLMPYTYLERMMEHQSNRNADRRLISKRFEGSGHVAHYKMHPKEYKSSIQDFLKSL